MISCCSALARGVPLPPRPVVHWARSKAVEPWSLVRYGSAPAARSTRTAPRAPVANCAVQGRNAAGGGGVRIGAGLDEVGNEVALPLRIPVGRAGGAHDRRVQRLSPPPVPGLHVGAHPDQLPGQLAVIRKSCCMQSAVPRIELGVAFGQEEFLIPPQPVQSQVRRRRQQLSRNGCLARGSSAHEPYQVPLGAHQGTVYRPVVRTLRPRRAQPVVRRR